MPLSKNAKNAKQVGGSHLRSKTRTPEEELARRIVPKLASRAYHLPGYNLRRDWTQYLLNNHPLLGICCHHRLHPLKMRQRLIVLLGSFSFGVAITNVIFLWFLGTGRDDEREVFAVDLSARESDSRSYSVTSGLLALLTVGSGSHAVFDRFVWTLSACGCCRAGGRFERSCFRGCCKSLAFYLAVFVVTLVVALATCVVIIRASVEEGQTNVPFIQNENGTKMTLEEMLDFDEIFDEFEVQDYSFIRGYALEFVVSLFVYYPLVETVLFSGVLGCGRIPFLGGRPYAMKQEAQKRSDARSICPDICPSQHL